MQRNDHKVPTVATTTLSVTSRSLISGLNKEASGSDVNENKMEYKNGKKKKKKKRRRKLEFSCENLLQQVKDKALSLQRGLGFRFDPWPGNFHMSRTQPK